MHDFYERFYAAVETSAVHARFCARVFGRNLCQHGFADMAQLEALIEASGPQLGDHALDLGCGNGMIAEYVSDRTGAHLTGIDYSGVAIAHARQRTADRADRLAFEVADINALTLPEAAFDVIFSVDTIYFSQDYAATMGELLRGLRPGGRMAFLYSHGREPWVPIEEFPVETLQPERTPLGQALRAHDLSFTVCDLTADDYRLAVLRRQVLEALEAQFAAEGLLFIYENRLGDANGIADAIERGLHRRYLILARSASA